MSIGNTKVHKRKGQSMRSYETVRQHARQFAADMKARVYITKSTKREAYRIIFEGEKTTPAFPIIEAIEPESEAAADC